MENENNDALLLRLLLEQQHLLQLWADDTLLRTRRRELLHQHDEAHPEEEAVPTTTAIAAIERDITRARNDAEARLQHGEIITVTAFINVILSPLMRTNQIAAMWLLHRFTAARINPILFYRLPTADAAELEHWIDDLRELLDYLHQQASRRDDNTTTPWAMRTLLLLEDQFPPALVQARLHELEHTLETNRQKQIAMMMATDKRWGKDSPLYSLDPDMLKRYLL
jgi:hypothetical protein